MIKWTVLTTAIVVWALVCSKHPAGRIHSWFLYYGGVVLIGFAYEAAR